MSKRKAFRANDIILVKKCAHIRVRAYGGDKEFLANSDFVARIPYFYQDDGGSSVKIADWQTTDKSYVEHFQMPRLPKDKRVLITKNSKWRVARSTEIFYLSNAETKHKMVTVPAGATLTVIDRKPKKRKTLVDEQSITVRCLEQKMVLPIRFFGNMACIHEGEAQVHWRIADKDGNFVRPKKYDNIGSLKSAVRIITGVAHDESGPKWLAEADSQEFNDRFNDWVAVSYDHKGNKLETVDLSEWFTFNKLTTV